MNPGPIDPNRGPDRSGIAATLAIFGAGYFLAVRLSEHAYGSFAVPSPLWLPDSVFLSALLLAPRRQWWMFALAIWPIRLLAGVGPGPPVWFQLVSIANDMVKGVAAAWLLTAVMRRPIRLSTLREFMVYLGIAAALVPALSALAAAPARYALGDPFWRTAYQWFLGDALAQVIVTPTLLYWWTRGYRDVGSRLKELLLVGAGLTGALLYAFVVNHESLSLIFVYLPVPFLIWAAVRLRPFGTANAVALVTLVSMVAAVRGTGIFAGVSGDAAVLAMQLFLLVLAISLLSLAIVTVEREELRAHEAVSTGRLLEAQDRERARIARELHDDIAQRMALLRIGIDQLGMSKGISAPARQQLDEFSQAAMRMAHDIHGLSHRLHPSTIDIGLEVAVKGLCHEFSERYGIEVHFSSRNVPAAIERDARLCLFRIAQEALQNVVKHSGVRTADVELSHHNDELALCVSDEGLGFDAEVNAPSGLGLASMRERLRPLQGQLLILTAPCAGTMIRAVVPLRPRAGATPAEPAHDAGPVPTPL